MESSDDEVCAQILADYWVATNAQAEFMRKVLAARRMRQAAILRWRERGLTFREIGKLINLSAARADQIAKEPISTAALNRLPRPVEDPSSTGEPGPCLTCGRDLKPAAPGSRCPADAVTAVIYGHRGSNAFNSRDGAHLEVNLCDTCVILNADIIRHVGPAGQGPTQPWDAPDLEEVYRRQG